MIRMLLATMSVALAYTREELSSFITGLMNHVLENHNHYAMRSCLQNTERISDDIDKIVEYFSRNTKWDIRQGFIATDRLMMQLKRDTAECEDMTTDAKALWQWASEFQLTVDYLDSPTGSGAADYKLFHDAAYYKCKSLKSMHSAGSFHFVGMGVGDIVKIAAGEAVAPTETRVDDDYWKLLFQV